MGLLANGFQRSDVDGAAPVLGVCVFNCFQVCVC